jgi:hypothetical protein
MDAAARRQAPSGPRELDEDDPRADTPPGCSVVLKDHQRAALHRCLAMEAGPLPLGDVRAPGDPEAGPEDTLRTRVGVIGDRVGSGKSYLVLSIVLATRGSGAPAEAVVRGYAGNRVVLTRRESASPVGATLLVIPHNLAAQWEGYTRAFGGSLRVVHVSRTKHLTELYERRGAELASLDLVVVTGTYYRHVAAALASWRVRLRRVVYDEADSLAVPAMAPVDASFHWFVTASYGNLLHPRGHCEYDPATREHVWRATGVRGTGFVKSLFTELACTTAGRDAARWVVVRSSDAFVQRSMHVPEPRVEHVRCRTPRSIRVLSGVADRSIIECLNAGDVAGALAHVSTGNRGTEEDIVRAMVDRLSRQLHNVAARLDLASALQFESEAEREAEVQRLTRRREELSQKVECIRARIAENSSCPICYEDIERGQKSVAPCCSNAFCFACVSRWAAQARACPLCKAPLQPRDLLVVDAAPPRAEPPPPRAEAEPEASKLAALERILRERRPSPGAAKVLVFSSYDNTFGEVTPLLARMGIAYRFLKGNHMMVQSAAREYKAGSLDVLLVNTNNYGSGLNLENTTDVVMFHKFDSEIERQVLGRALRYGRTAPLRVWYLVYEGEAPPPPA